MLGRNVSTSDSPFHSTHDIPFIPEIERLSLEIEAEAEKQEKQLIELSFWEILDSLMCLKMMNKYSLEPL